MEQYRNEVLELQGLEEEFADVEGRISSTPICASIVGGTAGAIWMSSISFRCA